MEGSYLQMSIGIERFMAICSPLRMQRFSTKTTTIMLGGVWAIAAVFAFPYLRYMGMVRNKSNQYCYWVKISNTSKLLFKYAEFLVLYAVPLVLLAVLYTVMSRVLWGKSSTIADETQQTAILKLRRSVVKMLIISILLYFLCYTPIQGLFVMEMIFHHHIPLARWVRLLLNLLSVMSSSLNPVVYIMCCCHFHSRFLLLLHSLSSFSKSNKYSCSNGDSDFAARLSRSPYVSFRRSMQKHQRHSVTLL